VIPGKYSGTDRDKVNAANELLALFVNKKNIILKENMKFKVGEEGNLQNFGEALKNGLVAEGTDETYSRELPGTLGGPTYQN